MTQPLPPNHSANAPMDADDGLGEYDLERLPMRLRDVVLERRDRYGDTLGGMQAWMAGATWLYDMLGKPEVELAMHRAREQGGNMRDCLKAALQEAFGPRTGFDG